MLKLLGFVLAVVCLIGLSGDQLQAQISIFRIIETLTGEKKPADEPGLNVKEKSDKEEKSEVNLTPSHEVVASVIVEGKGGNTLQSVAISNSGVVAGLVGRPRYSENPAVPTTEICIFDDKGSIIKRWDLTLTGQAIAFSPDEKIYVAGEGKIAIYEIDGKLIKEAALPHLQKILGDKEALRKTAIDSWNEEQERNKEVAKYYEADMNETKETIAKLEQKLADHKAKIAEEAKKSEPAKTTETQAPADKEPVKEEPLTSADKLPAKRGLNKKTQEERWETELKSMQKQLGQMEQLTNQFKVKENYTEEEIQSYMLSIPAKLGGVRSIAVTKENIIVITNAAKGYGYIAWKISPDMSESVVYKDKLSGCCSQVDLFANDKGIYMAENTKYRVGYYDLEGKLVTSYGKRARGKDEGFGGCCNPMNAYALADGTVFCSESAGEIKRFNADGTFAAFVGKVKLPNDGCKNVSFAVSHDGSKVYFADNVGSTLVILETATKKVTQVK